MVHRVGSEQTEEVASCGVAAWLEDCTLTGASIELLEACPKASEVDLVEYSSPSHLNGRGQPSFRLASVGYREFLARALRSQIELALMAAAPCHHWRGDVSAKEPEVQHS